LTSKSDKIVQNFDGTINEKLMEQLIAINYSINTRFAFFDVLND